MTSLLDRYVRVKLTTDGTQTAVGQIRSVHASSCGSRLTLYVELDGGLLGALDSNEIELMEPVQ